MSESLAIQAQLLVADTAVDLSRLLEPDILVRIVLQVLLLCGSAFFSGSEVALFSLSRMDLHQLRRERHPQASRLYALLDQPRRLIISILCGNEFINVAAAANMAAILLVLFDEGRAGWINILVMVPLLLLVGEVTPKTIAISNPVTFSTRVVAAPMTLWVRLVSPVRWMVRLVADRLTVLLVGEEASRESILGADEVRMLTRELEASGELQMEERVLVDALLETGTTEVVHIMRPRTQALLVEADTPLPEVVALVRTHRQQRVPVYRRHPDSLIGFLYAEDLMPLVLGGTDLSTLRLESLLHPVAVVPPTKRVDELLQYFREHGVQAAVVINEFGGLEGLVTMNGLIDFIFDPLSRRTGGDAPTATRGAFEVSGDMKLVAFDDLTNFGIDDPRMTTIGGAVFRHLDRLPEVGDEVTINGVEFRVLEMSGHRIARLQAGRALPEEDT